jgi:hypothetical protein
MAFGISFGSNKSKTDQKKTIDQTETTNQSGSEATAGSKATTSASQSASTQTAQQASTQQGTTTATSANQGSQVQESIRRLFSTGIQDELEGLTGSLLGSAQATEESRIAGRAALEGFDADKFVAGGLDRATSRINSQLDEALGSMFSAIGGTSGSNSAAALLANRLQGDAASELAGVEGQLTGQAQEILRQNLGTGESFSQGSNQFLTSLLGVLRGGVESTATQAQSTGTETNQQATQQSGTQTSAQQTQQTQVQQVMETMMQAVVKALSGTNTTTGTETLKGKTTERGGGFSLSI